MNKLLRFMLCAGLALFATQAIAAPPQTINYQGYLTNPGGTPVNSTVVMTFRLYNAASGGAAMACVANSARPAQSMKRSSLFMLLLPCSRVAPDDQTQVINSLAGGDVNTVVEAATLLVHQKYPVRPEPVEGSGGRTLRQAQGERD